MVRPLMAKAVGAKIGRGGCRGWRAGGIEANRTAGGIVIVIPHHVGLTDAQSITGDTETVTTEIPISPVAWDTVWCYSSAGPNAGGSGRVRDLYFRNGTVVRVRTGAWID